MVNLNWLALITSKLIGYHFTLISFRSEFLQAFPEIGIISLSSVSSIMTKELKMSYKKLRYSKSIIHNPINKENIEKWINIINWLRYNNYHIVYLDVFSLNRITTNLNGWSKRFSQVGSIHFLKLLKWALLLE